MITGALVQLNSSGPPDDPLGAILSYGWTRFYTGSGQAWVRPDHPQPGWFLLHWIKSDKPGHGRRLMEAIAQWAVENRFEFGTLVCEEALVDFYEKFDWYRMGTFNEGFEAMGWQP